jgi:aryl-alcohol dehydrogenase-like predicted oxidoreductase
LVPTTLAGGTITLADDLTLTRMGYGAMQLAGSDGDKLVWGPPRDREEALRVLHMAVEMGITHIDTSDFYGPHVTNEIIREALHPYPDDVRIVTKVGARRTKDGAWVHALSREDLIQAVHDNLEHLGVDTLAVVNLRLPSYEGPYTGSIAEPFGVLAELQEQGLIRHLGLSGVTGEHLTEAQSIAPVVTIQNHYNLANRSDDDLIERCAAENIAYAPYFPLGGFSPLQSETLDSVAKSLESSPQQVALAWLLQRSPTIVLIPGTSSVAHLRENIAAADLELPEDAIAELDGIGV